MDSQATNGPYCQRQVHDFVTNSDRFAAFGVQVLLVYPEPPADLDQRAKEFLVKQNELPANLHLVIDSDYKFTNSMASARTRRKRPLTQPPS